MGSSSSSRVAPESCSSRIWNRACWPPERDSYFCSDCAGQPVAVQRPGGGLAAQPRAVLVAAVQDFQQGLAQQVGPDVGLGEEAGPDPGAEFHGALVRHLGDLDVGHRQVLPLRIGAAGGEQAQEVALARAVGAEDAHAVAEPDLGGERLHQAGQFQLFGDDGALGGAAALEPHLHVLLDRQGLGRPGLEELRQAGLRGVVPVGHVGAERGLVLVHVDEFLELHVLLVPALAQLLEAGVPVARGRPRRSRSRRRGSRRRRR